MSLPCVAFGAGVAVVGFESQVTAASLTCQRWGADCRRLVRVQRRFTARPTACAQPNVGQPSGLSSTTVAKGSLEAAVGGSDMDISDAMEFFRFREGTWASDRVTHHLAFRRSESGSSEIVMKCLAKDDEQIVRLLDDNNIPRHAAQGGCYVTWKATMAWDQEGENHEGSTVFALVPDEDDIRKGRIIRDRGYAEIVPIAGRYYLDSDNALCLTTPYEGGSVEERFAFTGANMLHRVSTVRRFGGMSNATFATESRLKGPSGEVYKQRSADEATMTHEEEDMILSGRLLLFGGGRVTRGSARQSYGAGKQGTFLSGSASRLAAASAARAASSGRPSPGSAFGSGFSNSRGPGRQGGQSDSSPPPRDRSNDSTAATTAGIDLSKVPPSMRADFAKSLGVDLPEPSDGNGA